ncbi:hormogonium polysaccharide secretion pseudopilin HpsB [Okeania sp.]|uniref:hormogonium polysaccharide secretion pseudopilin HpsB n=1 Tax=Okeania sp. TaxID=3100323 RepID=UPI002B4B7064|nr:hormogonium polysaccharide secretion pseudopilin HpsB [Okeania sp.]MEB3342536.1 hormogonium polysaccharide secretion pseudopilin HpsB [Okeania sp.]
MKLKQRLKNNFFSPEAGYTMIEGLIAMVIVAAIMSAVAPIIAVSVGTRVQARRVELATQAARSYIDAVRKGQLSAPEGFVSDQQISATALTECSQTDGNNLQYCPTALISQVLGQFYCVDGDGDGECTPESLTDMMVHGAIIYFDLPDSDYKNQILTADSATKSKLGYILKVRVFRAKAFASSVKLSNQDVPFTVNNAGLATRSGDVERPLFVTKVEIAPKSLNGSFQKICDRLGGGDCQ